MEASHKEQQGRLETATAMLQNASNALHVCAVDAGDSRLGVMLRESSMHIEAFIGRTME